MSETVGPTRVVDVDFHAAPLEEVSAPVMTDDAGSAPRPSRRIEFADDGKLFEGHLTVQSRNLKSIIQFVVDQHAEQAVILHDLQDQVNSLRSKIAKASRTGAGLLRGGGGGAGAGPMELDELSKRVKKLESFVTLWGVRPEDVHELVQSYGDPVVTPDQYTSYLLDLPCFRLTRREARALAAVAATNSVAAGGGGRSGSLGSFASAQDTAARRSQSQVGGRPGPGQRTTAAAPSSNSSNGGSAGQSEDTKKVLEGLAEAMHRIEELEKQLQQQQQWQDAQARSGGAVDAQGRQGAEELGECVTRRLPEMESRSLLAAASAAGSASSKAAAAAPVNTTAAAATRLPVERRQRRGSAEARAALAPREAQTNAHARDRHQPSPANTLSTSTTAGSAAVDTVAREDAAASLEMIENLETTVERRFRELATQIANLAMRTSNGAGSTHVAGKNSTAADGAAAAAAGTSPGRTDGSARGGRKDVSESRSPTLGAAVATNVCTATPVAPATPNQGSGSAVDTAAREEVTALSDRLADFEEDLTKRWQALEERLRIIGRACMSRAAGGGAGGAGSGGASMDRKAREDASLSLMRVQQLEREIALLRRQLAAAAANGGGGGGAARACGSLGELTDRGFDGPLRAGAVAVAGALSVPPDNLRDTYTSSINDLEKEVEERMLEVNRAIAILKRHEIATPITPSVAGQGLSSTLEPALMQAAAECAAAPPPCDRNTAAVMETDVPTTSCVVLRSTDGGGENPLTPPLPEVNRREDTANANNAARAEAARHFSSVLQLSSQALTPAGTALNNSAHRRLTVSRLRAPNEPLIGSFLVVRDMVTDEELEDLLAKVGEAGKATHRGESDAAAVASSTPAAERGSNRSALSSSPGAATTAATGSSALVHPLAQELAKGRGAAAAAASLSSKRGGGAGHLLTTRDVTMSALGHTNPCVIVNCAWCQAERDGNRGGSGMRQQRAEVV